MMSGELAGGSPTIIAHRPRRIGFGERDGRQQRRRRREVQEDVGAEIP